MSGTRALTIAELADRLGVSRSWVDRRLAAGELPHLRAGTGRRAVIRFTAADVTRIEAALHVEPLDHARTA